MNGAQMKTALSSAIMLKIQLYRPITENDRKITVANQQTNSARPLLIRIAIIRRKHMNFTGIATDVQPFSSQLNVRVSKEIIQFAYHSRIRTSSNCDTNRAKGCVVPSKIELANCFIPFFTRVSVAFLSIWICVSYTNDRSRPLFYPEMSHAARGEPVSRRAKINHANRNIGWLAG